MARYEEFTIDQGSDIAIELHCVNEDGSKKNLANYDVAAKMKRNYNSDSADTVTLNGIIGNSQEGIVTLNLTSTVSDTLKRGKYVYDVELSFTDSDGNVIVERILEGRMQVTPSVTR